MKKTTKVVNTKKELFKTFLDSTTTNTNTSDLKLPPTNSKKVNSDNEQFEQYVEETNSCAVCFKKETEKNNKCGFCSLKVCKDCMRKKRKNKGKFDNICDTCQNKYLYQFLTKAQKQVEQSLAIQQEIVYMKYQEVATNLKERQSKREKLKIHQKSMTKKYSQTLKKLQQQQKFLNETLLAFDNQQNEILKSLDKIQKDFFAGVQSIHLELIKISEHNLQLLSIIAETENKIIQEAKKKQQELIMLKIQQEKLRKLTQEKQKQKQKIQNDLQSQLKTQQITINLPTNNRVQQIQDLEPRIHTLPQMILQQPAIVSISTKLTISEQQFLKTQIGQYNTFLTLVQKEFQLNEKLINQQTRIRQLTQRKQSLKTQNLKIRKQQQQSQIISALKREIHRLEQYANKLKAELKIVKQEERDLNTNSDLENDYKFLLQQSEKNKKQLQKLQKRVGQLRSTILKKQKQLEQQFDQLEKKTIEKENERKCIIF